MKDKVSIYFDVAKKALPVISEDELLRGLNRTQTKRKNQIKRVSLTAAFVVSAAAGIIYYYTSLPLIPVTVDPTQKVQTNIDTAKVLDEVVPNALNKDLPEQNAVNTKKENSSNTIASVLEIPFPKEIPLADSSLTLLPLINEPQQIEQPKLVAEEGTLHLTNNELMNLGINTNGKKLTFACRRHEHDDSLFFTVESDFRGTSSVDGADQAQLGKSKLAEIIPVAVEMSVNGNYIYLNPEIQNNRRDQFMKESKYLLVKVPIEVRTGMKNTNKFFFWYKPDASFTEILPEDVRNSILPNINQYNETAFQSILKKYSQVSREPVFVKMVNPSIVNEANNNSFQLNEEELNKLHIKTVKNGFLFKNSFQYKGHSCKLEIRMDSLLNYSSTTVKDGKYLFAESEELALHPIAITDSTLKEINLYHVIAPKRTPGTSRLEAETQDYKTFFDAIPEMIAVKLVTKVNQGRRIRLMWFPDTNATVRKVIKDHMQTATLNKHAVDLSKVKLIEPDELTLKKLHISIDDGSISVPMMWGTKSSIIQKYSAHGSESTIPGISQSEFQKLPENEKGDSIKIRINDGQMTEFTQYFKRTPEKMITPAMATDELGKYFYFYTSDSIGEVLTKEDYAYMRRHSLNLNNYPKAIRINQELHARASDKATHLIGVKVSSSPFPSAKGNFSMILWYEPSSEFLALLPNQIGKEIQQEYTAILNDAPAPSCNYFEACKNIKGEICQVTAFPNPFVDELDLEIELGNDRVIGIALTDINGKLVKQAELNKPQLKGKTNYQIQTQNLSEGIYLVVVTTDKGERIVKRVIKK